LDHLNLLPEESGWQRLVSILLVSTLVVTLLALYWQQFYGQLHDGDRYLLIMGILILLFTGMARLMIAFPGVAYLFPIAALSMMLAVILDGRLAIVVTLVMAVIVGYISRESSLELTLYTALGGIIAVLVLRDTQRINALFRAGLTAAVAHMAVILIFRLRAPGEPSQLLELFLFALANGVISASLTLAGFFIAGSIFGIITTLQLQELSRLDHPLLQELLRKAPGTYHHSIMVANLAEQAAERIQANSNLVRVGSFYHDVGKMTRPPFFTENQEGVSPHDTLDPHSSARIILSHVTDGLRMAREHRLPTRIRDFIAEHHGTRVVKAFYTKAIELAGEDASQVDVSRFRYRGPRPRSRETGIVQLADSIEATSTALRPDTEGAIEKLINSIIDDHLKEGQLDQSGLTLGDIQRLRESFTETLKGRFHVRVRYPGNDVLESPTGEVEQLAGGPLGSPALTGMANGLGGRVVEAGKNEPA
jgi:putative nucleotidyltransferase with HDIG domain